MKSIEKVTRDLCACWTWYKAKKCQLVD